MNEKECFQKAFALVSNEATWTQGSLAKDKYGHRVEPLSDIAVCWCSVGAVIKAVEGPTIASRRVRDQLSHTADVFLSYFNDHHTHAEVVDVWRRTGERMGWL